MGEAKRRRERERLQALNNPPVEDITEAIARALGLTPQEMQTVMDDVAFDETVTRSPSFKSDEEMIAFYRPYADRVIAKRPVAAV